MTQTTTIDSHNGLRRPQAFTPALTMPSYVEALVDPGGMFRNPAEVAEDAWFSREEKRTVLLSWARDELVLEQVASTALPELKPRSRIAADRRSCAIGPTCSCRISRCGPIHQGADPASFIHRHHSENTGESQEREEQQEEEGCMQDCVNAA